MEIAIKKRINPFDVLLAVSFCLMFLPTFKRLKEYGWDSADYTHAYLILPVAAYLIYRKRESLSRADSINRAGLVLFILGTVLYLFSALNGFMFLEAFSFCVVAWGLFRLRFTANSCREIMFPLAYLVFLVPPPQLAIDLVTFPLKQISAWGSYLLLKLLQVPVKFYGAILEIKQYQLFVADACSGFRSIVTLLALGAVYAYFQNIPNRHKWILFFSVIPLGIVGNIARITLTGWISYHFSHEYAEGFFHFFSGMILFVLTLGGLILLSEWMSRCHHA